MISFEIFTTQFNDGQYSAFFEEKVEDWKQDASRRKQWDRF